jgi:hypothetical protein
MKFRQNDPETNGVRLMINQCHLLREICMVTYCGVLDYVTTNGTQNEGGSAVVRSLELTNQTALCRNPENHKVNTTVTASNLIYTHIKIYNKFNFYV